MVRAVVVFVLKRAFVVVGAVVAATTRTLAGRGRDLDQISIAINQETGLAEMRCQPEGAVEPLDELREHGFVFRAEEIRIYRFSSAPPKGAWVLVG
jgi:hypothetical protein